MNCKKCGNEIPAGSVFCNWCGEKQVRSRKKKTAELSVPKPRQLPSGKWFIQLRLNGKSIPITKSTERECIEEARAIKAGILETKQHDDRTVGDVIDAYINSISNVASPSTIDSYERKRRNNLQSLMPLTVDELTKDTVQAAINEDAKKYAGKTIKDALAVVRVATGIRFKKDELKLPSTAPKKTPPVLSSDDIQKLIVALAEIGGEVECAALLAMWLSLRRSEIKGLEWQDIGEDGIAVTKAMVYDKHHKLVEKITKTEKSRRYIRCSPYVLDKIKALPQKGDKVFQMSTSGLWNGVTNACKQAGIKHTYLHGLRHTNATVMAMLKIDVKYAMKRGGWSSADTMRKIYQDIMAEAEVQVADDIDAYFLKLANGQIANENANA